MTCLYEKLNDSDKNAISQFCQDFGKFLERNANLFVEARYHHEGSMFAFREQEILGFAVFLVQYLDNVTNKTPNRTP